MTKKMLLTALIAVSFGIVQAQTVPTVTQDISTVTDSKPAVTQDLSTVTSSQKSFYEQIPLVGDLIGFAKEHLSIRYRSGGSSKRGFDCSGFTRFCFSQFGISLPHSSAAQGNVGQAVDQADAKPGDLILFKGHSSGGSHIGHVGLITEVVGDRIKFIHSAWNGGVRYDYLHASYYQRRFVGVRRVLNLLTNK
ncbi:C40 family peptidase [Spirosoma endbachense]|uniref:CHAP domain-containing protein n=1 Tax=Spirosoma endbachense TaxID=2666025 RepID=A0A6P1W4L8_9BACT|nr:C40 family peptidase [Spirosoma endbachense]QHV99518.1 CHAP domain-containing protein [Spirosoma endbachense]